MRKWQLILLPLLIAVVWLWSWQDFRDQRTLHRQENERLGYALVGSSEGQIARLCRGGRYDVDELHGAMEAMLPITGGQALALVSSKDEVLASSSTPGTLAGPIFEASLNPPMPRGKGRGMALKGVPLSDGPWTLRLTMPATFGLVQARGDRNRFIKNGSWLTLLLLALAGLQWSILRQVHLRGRLQRSEDRLEHLNYLERLGAGLAHETRNPLGLVRGYAQRLMQAPPDGETTREVASTIVKQADRTLARLDEFLALSRPMVLNKTVFSIGGWVEDLCELLAPEAEERGIQLSCTRLDNGEDPVEDQIVGDRDRLMRLLMNLVLNAVQAAGEGSRIQVHFAARDQQPYIRVEDDGPGIPDDIADTLFEPYVTRRVGGTGLGLSLSRSIAREHGWSLRYEARPGGGSLFILEPDLPE